MKWFFLILAFLMVWVGYILFKKPGQPTDRDYEGETIAQHWARTERNKKK